MRDRTAALDALDRRWERIAYAELSFDEALARFSALWREAMALGSTGGEEWLADLKPDLAVARAVNGLPPA